MNIIEYESLKKGDYVLVTYEYKVAFYIVTDTIMISVRHNIPVDCIYSNVLRPPKFLYSTYIRFYDLIKDEKEIKKYYKLGIFK